MGTLGGRRWRRKLLPCTQYSAPCCRSRITHQIARAGRHSGSVGSIHDGGPGRGDGRLAMYSLSVGLSTSPEHCVEVYDSFLIDLLSQTCLASPRGSRLVPFAELAGLERRNLGMDKWYTKQILPLVGASLLGAGLGAASLWVALSRSGVSVELCKSRSRILELEARLEAFESRSPSAAAASAPTKARPQEPAILPAPPSKRVRVYVDGCFDLM